MDKAKLEWDREDRDEHESATNATGDETAWVNYIQDDVEGEVDFDGVEFDHYFYAFKSPEKTFDLVAVLREDR